MTDRKQRLANHQAAEFIGCSPATLKTSRTTGQLLGHEAPHYRKLGKRKVVYDVETLQAWLDQFGTRTSTAA